MIRNIIVEGIDCSGKSTLVNLLKNTLRWDARSLAHKPGDQFSRYLAEYAALERTVIDRSHISEAVYSRLFGRETPFARSEEKILNGIVRETALVIACIPPLPVALKRYDERGYKQIIKRGELAHGRALFQNYFKRHPELRVLHYGSRDWDELRRLVRRVEKVINSV